MSITPESVKELLGSEDLGDRLRAVNQIRELEPPVAFELLQTGIADRNARVRYSLGGQDLPLALTVLRDRLLNDPEPDVQAAAADCLGALKLTEAFTDLQHTYHTTPEWLVKFSIIATLGELGDPRAFDLLKEALVSDNDLVQTAAISSLQDWQIRYRVVQALSRLGGPEAHSTIAALANDQVEAVAAEAKNCLNKTS